jgi:hypothetical protein
MVMARVIIGVFCTLVAALVSPVLGAGVAVIFGVWVVLGIGSQVANAEARATEHKVMVVGSVARAVIEEAATAQSVRARGKASMIECPSCDELMSTSAFERPACGWYVPDDARGMTKQLRAGMTTTAASSSTKPCPGCSKCRAPTVWVEEFDRFLCERCNLYA